MQVAFTYFLARLNVLGIFYLCLSVIVFLRLFLGLYAFISHYSPLWSCQGFSLNHDNLKWLPYLLAHKLKGLEILIAVVFCKECVLPVQGWFLFCKGGGGWEGNWRRGWENKNPPCTTKTQPQILHLRPPPHKHFKKFPAPLYYFLLAEGNLGDFQFFIHLQRGI